MANQAGGRSSGVRNISQTLTVVQVNQIVQAAYVHHGEGIDVARISAFVSKLFSKELDVEVDGPISILKHYDDPTDVPAALGSLINVVNAYKNVELSQSTSAVGALSAQLDQYNDLTSSLASIRAKTPGSVDAIGVSDLLDRAQNWVQSLPGVIKGPRTLEDDVQNLAIYAVASHIQTYKEFAKMKADLVTAFNTGAYVSIMVSHFGRGVLVHLSKIQDDLLVLDREMLKTALEAVCAQPGIKDSFEQNVAAVEKAIDIEKKQLEKMRQGCTPQ